MPPKKRVAAQKRRWANARKEAAEAEPDVEPVELEEESEESEESEEYTSPGSSPPFATVPVC